MEKAYQKEINYKGYHIVQNVQWVNNPMDGAGYEVKTTIKELPKYSGFDQLNWLNKEQQKSRILNAEKSAKSAIDRDIKDKEPTIFDDLGFKVVTYKNVGIKHA